MLKFFRSLRAMSKRMTKIGGCFGGSIRDKSAMFQTGISVRYAENSDVARRLRLNGGTVRALWSCDESLFVVRRGSNRVAIQHVIANDKIRLLKSIFINF